MFNVNLKDSKMGHSPHSNPRDVGKSPKVVVGFKNWTHLISQNTQYIEISGVIGKIVREICSMKIKLFGSNILGLKHTLYSFRQQYLLLLSRDAIGQGHQMALQGNILNFLSGPRLHPALQGLWTAGSSFQGLALPSQTQGQTHNISCQVTFYILKYGGIF